MSDNLLVSTREMTVRRGGRTILRHVDLDIFSQEIVTIIGPNGAGKSTLLDAVLGLIPLSSGTINRKSGITIGYVPQRLNVQESLPLSVEAFINLSPHGSNHPPKFKHLLEDLGCHILLNRPVSSLSGGETQRVLLARALIRSPDLLVLDEPAQGMDVVGEKALHHFLESLRQDRAMGLLLVSHDLHFVMATTDRVICLNHHVCCSGTPTSVCSDPEFLALFGEQVKGFGLYQHNHDHQHALQGLKRSQNNG